MSDTVDHKAPKGKFRVVVYDSFDNGQAVVGDFKGLEAAQEKARSVVERAGQMTIAYIHDEKGTIIDRFGSY